MKPFLFTKLYIPLKCSWSVDPFCNQPVGNTLGRLTKNINAEQMGIKESDYDSMDSGFGYLNFAISKEHS